MFYEQLKKACTMKGVVLTHLLRELGMSTGNSGKWKQGGTPSVEVLHKLSERLEVSVDYLLGKTDDPTPADKKNTPLESMDSKEIIRQALIKEGIIPADRPMTDEERNALLAMCEAFFNRQKES